MKKYLAILFAVFLSFLSIPAFADSHRGHGDSYWGRGPEWRGHGYIVRRLPPGYRTIIVSGNSYLYEEGIFYKYSPAGYMVIEPPLGAVVPVLPSGYTTVVVQKTPYYVWQDTYFTTAPTGGYVVAPAPAVAVTESKTVTEAAPAIPVESKVNIDSYDIYIPNENGSYTLVTLKKSDKGFIGPQGEIYAEHPTIEQLKTMYGKK